MENKCKNKKCQRILPEGYKHKYCENCRNEQVNTAKNVGKGMLSVAVVVVTVATAGRIKPGGKG